MEDSVDKPQPNRLSDISNRQVPFIRREHIHELMTEQEAAAYLGVSISGMRKWRARGFGPAYCRFGKIIRYRKSSLDEFADLHTSSNKGPRNQPLSIEE